MKINLTSRRWEEINECLRKFEGEYKMDWYKDGGLKPENMALMEIEKPDWKGLICIIVNDNRTDESRSNVSFEFMTILEKRYRRNKKMGEQRESNWRVAYDMGYDSISNHRLRFENFHENRII